MFLKRIKTPNPTALHWYKIQYTRLAKSLASAVYYIYVRLDWIAKALHSESGEQNKLYLRGIYYEKYFGRWGGGGDGWLWLNEN